MTISAARPLPSTNELLAILKQELPHHYTCNLYGLGQHKSIIVAKSSSVAAQISTHGKEITIQGSLPPPVSYLFSAVWWNEFVVVLLLFGGLSLKSRLKDFEKELGTFFKKKFN